MTNFFGFQGTNFGPLLQPQTAADFQRLHSLTNRYKLDPAFAKSVDENYGPFDWLLPEAHAIYWGAKALDEAAKNPDKVKPEDLITVRRIIYQSLLQSLKHGRVIANPFNGSYALGPNVDLVDNLNKFYLKAYADENDRGQKDGILKAHRNSLREAIYFLYEANRMDEARKWFKYLGEHYPDKPILDGQPNSYPRNITLDEYAVGVVQTDITETSQERVTSAIQSLLMRAYACLADGEEDRYQNFLNLARRVHERYVKATSGSKGDVRIPLLPFKEMEASVVRYLIDPQSGVPYAARAALVTRLGLPAAMLAPAEGETNAAAKVAEPASTNSILTNAVSPLLP
jgi:hypothetical protein